MLTTEDGDAPWFRREAADLRKTKAPWVADRFDRAADALEKSKGLDAVAVERWKELKAAEKLIRQLEKALKAVLYIAKTDTGPVHSQLRRDIREAEKVLEIVASVKRQRRSQA